MRRALLVAVLLALLPAVAWRTERAGAAGIAPGLCSTPQLVAEPTWSGAPHQQYVEKYLMAPRVATMIRLVNATGHTLAVESGYRSCDEQVELRRTNCGTSDYAVYQMPSTQCTPDTAIPGTSKHQYGLAVDWSCDGILIRDNPSCQAVVRQYAAQAQLVNYSPEPWHYGVVDENNPRGDYATDALPTGSLDGINGTAGGERITGWVADPDVAGPVAVFVTVDGTISGVGTANGARPDVQAAGKARSVQSGVDLVVPIPAGKHQVCLGSQGNQPNRPFVQIGCVDRTVNGPTGALDGATPTVGGVEVRGWGYDPDARGSTLDVRVLVDGAQLAATGANLSRPDVDRATGAGANHGYDVVAKVPAGSHTVCAVGIDQPTGFANTVLGCTAVTLTAPVAVLDSVTSTLDGIRVQGWAFDPDATGSAATVRVVLDGVASSVTANGSRPDVDQATRAGASHGFDATLAVGLGQHTVCVTVADVPTASFVSDLGCRTVSWPPPVVRGVDPLPQPAVRPHRGVRGQ